MATSAAERVKCAGCGLYVRRRPDWYGQDHVDDERGYSDEYEEHACAQQDRPMVSAVRESRARATMPVTECVCGGGVEEMAARRKRARDLDLVGMPEIAVMLDVHKATVRRWRTMHLLPEAAMVGHAPVWTRWEILDWAAKTDLGNLPAEQVEQVAGQVG